MDLECHFKRQTMRNKVQTSSIQAFLRLEYKSKTLKNPGAMKLVREYFEEQYLADKNWRKFIVIL